MNKGSKSEQIWALRAEASEARRLASRLVDAQSVKDLNGYATALEAEAARLQAERNLSSKPAPNSMKSLLAQGHAVRMQAIAKDRGAR